MLGSDNQASSKDGTPCAFIRGGGGRVGFADIAVKFARNNENSK